MKTIPIEEKQWFSTKKIVDKKREPEYNMSEFERNKSDSSLRDLVSGFDSDKEIQFKKG